MRDIKWFIVTTTDTPDEEHCDARSEQRKALSEGMRKIPYHYVILKNGEIQSGRPLLESAFVLKGYNGESIAIALAGTTASKPQEDALFELIARLHNEYPRASAFDIRNT